MFVQKSDQEVNNDNVKIYFDIRRPLVCFLILFIRFCSLTWFDFRTRPVEYFEILPLDIYLNKNVPFALFLSILAFFIAYGWNIKYRAYPFFNEPILCIKCGKKTDSQFYQYCDCGGKYFQRRKLKKVHNNNTQQNIFEWHIPVIVDARYSLFAKAFPKFCS